MNTGIESVLEEKRRYQPSDDFKAQANITDKIYQDLMQKAKDPQKFWADLAREELSWFEDFNQSISGDKPFFKCFEGGKFNISYNCIDRHLKVNGGNRDDKPALVWEGEPGDTKQLSYAELHAEVCKLANALKSLGLGKGDVVTIYMPLMAEAVIAMHACNRIGAIHSVVFGGFSAQALKDRVIDGKSKLVITADGLFRKGGVVPLVNTVKEAIDDLDIVENVLVYPRINQYKKTTEIDFASYQTKSGNGYKDWLELIDSQSAECEPEQLEANDISFILYTSGSTGKPKGIQHRTAGYLLWAHLTCKWVFDLKEDDIYWCTADVGWITGHSYVAYGPLSNGATCLLYEGAPNYPEADRFWNLVEKYKVTVFYTAPTAVRAFIQWGLEHIEKHDLSSLRLLGTVGEPINPDVWVWYYENIGKSKCPIVDTWWQTETGGIMITTLPGVHHMVPGSAGKPLPGVDAAINEEGLLHIKSPWASMLMTVYGDDQRYQDTYWSQVPGSYTAGDGACQDQDGFIEIMGRVDDVINVSGHRLGTAEVESALVAHDKVSEAAVVSIPHEIKGEGIVAYVVLKNDVSANGDFANQLKDQVVQEIGAIARPERVIICNAVPKTRSGKIMRRLLRDLAQGKEPSGDISTIENASVLEELRGRSWTRTNS